MSVFEPMADRIPESTHGTAKVEHFEVTKGASMMTALRGGRDFVAPGKYARLRVGGKLFMSDTRWERISNTDVVRHAHGHVLIAGLGLGMILVPILRKPEVLSVTVLEKSADVIALIAPHFNDSRLNIINADVFEWKPPKGSRWNVVYFDVWADTSTDDLPSVAKLHQRFKFFLDRTDEKRWMESWNRDYLKDQRRRERSNPWA